jgi:hypothetical protein
LEGFEQFALAFRLLVSRAAESNAYRRLLSFLGVNASVYPLMIALEAEQIANESMLDLVEKLDLRVYKIRGTEPRADLYRDTISLIKLRPDQEHIKNGMEKVVRDFMGEAEFQAYLARSIYGNPAVKYILWEYENSQDPELGYWQLDYYKDLQVEHIFPVETTLGFPAYGFSEAAEYIASINKLGNLLTLEEGINKRVSNEVPTNKAREYLKSCIPGTKRQGYQISTSGFVKADVENRTERIIQFCARRWGLAA